MAAKSRGEIAVSAEVVPVPDPGSTDGASVPPESVRAPAGDVKELRLGLVCYGGVSLAIYMHGITKEINRAVRASVLEEHEADPDAGSGSERGYRALLKALRAEREVGTRIVVDVIAGS